MSTIVDKNIATINQEDDTDEHNNEVANNKIKVLFLVQNVAFSANFSNESIVEKKKLQLKLNINERKGYLQTLTLQRSILFDDEKISQIAEKIRLDIESNRNVSFSPSYKKLTRFPATIIKCEFFRHDSELYKFKSDASIRRKLAGTRRKRKETDLSKIFDIQKCSFSSFASGLVNTTGANVKQDIVNILNVLQIFNSFLDP